MNLPFETVFTMKRILKSPNTLWIAALIVVFAASFAYIFDPKLNFNGDNCYYFANATSLANGDGYADMFGKPTNNFPPGYPLLMVPLRMLTDSIIAQKLLNGLFLLVGTLLLFSIMVRAGFKRNLAFLTSSAVLVTPHLLEFSTMMMSEASCFCCIALVFWLYQGVLRREEEGASVWRMPQFYLFLAALVFSYYIRTQALALVVGFALAMLVKRRYAQSAAVVAAFAVGYLPWMLRNASLGLGQSRYVSQIDFSNIFTNLKMLIVQAIPESVIPFFPVNYEKTPSVLLYIIAFMMLAIILYGFWNSNKLRWPLFFYFCGTLGIIAIMDTPSQYRYVTTAIPFLTLGMFVGLWHLFSMVTKFSLGKNFSAWFLLVLFVPMTFQKSSGTGHTIGDLRLFATMKFPAHYENFFNIGKVIADFDPKGIVCSRKPELLYAASGMRGVHYLETEDTDKMLRSMIDRKVDYVIFEQLGYSSTEYYLMPCIKMHPELFKVIGNLPNPDTYLFSFDRRKAMFWLLNKNK